MAFGFKRSLVSLFAVALAGTLSAQDTKEQFKKAKELLLQNKDAEALEALRGVLNADPTNEQAFEMWRETDHRVWLMALEKGGEIEKIAKSLITRATMGRKAFSADAAKIAELVTKSMGDSYVEARDANMALAADHGEYAVPALVEHLGNADSDKGQTGAIMALRTIGRPAVLPLLACLRSDNMTLRRNAASALMYIGDKRAAADVKLLAERDESEAVKIAAGAAAAKLGAGNTSANELFLRRSHDFLVGSSAAIRDDDTCENVWSLKEGKLTATAVPKALFTSEMAKESAYGALAADPSSEKGLVALARAYIGEKALVDENAEDENLKPVALSLADLGTVIQGAGNAAIRGAVRAEMAEGRAAPAVAGIKVLARIEDPNTINNSPLFEALDSGDKRIAYAAALAISGMGGKAVDVARGKVVARLGEAVGEQALRIVRYIDSDAKARAVATETSNRGKGIWVDASALNGLDGILHNRVMPGADVIVVNTSLADVTAQDVVRDIKSTPKLASTKIILVSGNVAADEAAFKDKVDKVVAGPITADALRGTIEEVLKDVPVDAGRKRADVIATDAAQALAGMDNLGSIYKNLAEAAERDDAVAVPALTALGNAGNEGLACLSAAVKNSARSPAVRAAAAGAMGSVFAQTGAVPPKDMVTTLAEVAKTDADTSVRAAAVAALGRANLTAMERVALLRDLRINAGAAPAGGAKPEGETKPADEPKQ